MKVLLAAVIPMLLFSHSSAQIRSAVQGRSLYSDTVLKLLIRSSQLAADRRQSVIRGSALGANETSTIRRSSSFSGQDRAQIDRLSTFAGDRLRRMEALSEFREDQVARMRAAFEPRDVESRGERQFALAAEKHSNMLRNRLLQVLRSSDSKEWSRRIREGAVPVGDFSALLKRRSLTSREGSREIQRLSLDK